MKNLVKIFKTIRPFNKSIQIEGDKSLSIRWALLASQAKGKSKSSNLLRSEDVLNTLECLKKLGVKIKLSKNYCIIYGKGLNKFKYKKKITLNAGNSGTLGRLLMGLLVHSKSLIKIKGDKSLSKRDFNRVIIPLKKFGAKFKSNSGKLPIEIYGTKNPKPIKSGMIYLWLLSSPSRTFLYKNPHIGFPCTITIGFPCPFSMTCIFFPTFIHE